MHVAPTSSKSLLASNFKSEPTEIHLYHWKHDKSIKPTKLQCIARQQVEITNKHVQHAQVSM